MRLTRKETGEILIKDGWSRSDTNNYTSLCYGCGEINRCVNKCGFYKAFKKLAEYEDLNLTADEVRDNANAFAKDRAYFFEEKEKMKEEIKELKQERDYWKKEALKWANELGEQRLDWEG